MNGYRVIRILSCIVFFGALGYIIYNSMQYSAAKRSYRELEAFVETESTTQAFTEGETKAAVEVSTAEETHSEITTEEVILPYEETPLKVDHAGLKRVNGDYCGWLSACGGSVRYPIVKGKDNEEYLHKTFYGNRSFAGCIFMDKGNSADFGDFHTALYGHSMKDGSMFRRLINYKSEKYYKRYPYFYIYTESGSFRYSVFAVYEADGEDVSMLVGEDKGAFISGLKARSLYACGEGEIPEDANVISLVTCDVSDTSQRIVVVGVRDR